MKLKKTYSELIAISDYRERLGYLQETKNVGKVTFGDRRYLNQLLYHCYEWRKIRREVIFRDNACDLGHPDFPINGKIYVHHINSISEYDILHRSSMVFDLENLIACAFQTHNYIHYGVPIKNQEPLVQRTINDTCPWK